MQTLSEIRALLDARGLRPRHRFGQNFLHDHNQIRRLIERSAIAPGDCVLEVGPGTGALTEALVEAGGRVLACEIDLDMAAIVTDRVIARAPDQVALVIGDCLDGKHALSVMMLEAVDSHFAGRPFKLVANLPYQAATPLMIMLLTTRADCVGQFVTIQREVAQRIVAKPGSRDYGPLAVYSSLLARSEVFAELPPSCFWPAPEVTSAMVAIERLPSPPSLNPIALGEFMHTLFSKRRKQIGTILGRDGAWPEGILPSMRPEELTPPQIVALMVARTTR